MDIQSLMNKIDEQREDLITLHQELVKIPSVNTGFMPTGNETAVCNFVKDWLKKQGIESEILARDPDRGNIIASIEGKSKTNGLLFMSHTDVVPVEDIEKWEYEPFSAKRTNGRIYGRGASDCKGLLACQLFAMKIIKESGIQLNDNLVLASGADEEHGGRYGFGWLVENHLEKISSPYAVNEGGGEAIQTKSNTTYAVGVGEKGRLQIEIDVKGSSAHASTPWQGENASYLLRQVLERIENYEPERDTSTNFFEYLSLLAIEHKPMASNIDSIISEVEQDSPRLASRMKALSRMTVTPTMLSGGIKSNSVPESIRLTCDVRTLPTQNETYLRNELDKMFEGIPNVRYEIDNMALSNESKFETPLMESLKRATSLAVGDDNIQYVPAISTGFTDSRFLRPTGTITYGFSGSHPDDDPMLSFIHGTNESVGIKSLINGAKIMTGLVIDMLT